MFEMVTMSLIKKIQLNGQVHEFRDVFQMLERSMILMLLTNCIPFDNISSGVAKWPT